MPIRLPKDRRPKAKALTRIETLDWLTVWSISVGVCAMILAATVYFAAGDHAGATVILMGGAVVMAFALRGASR